MTDLSRWTPFDDMLKLNTAMEQLFSNSFVPVFNRASSLSLPLDVTETDETYIVQAVVPGISADSLDIEVKDQVLTIRGEWKRVEQPKDATYHLKERPTGRFERRLQLPLPLNTDGVTATYEDGILTLALPKAEVAKPRKITLQSQPRQLEAQTA
jgi:HSP20 family protein